MEKTQEEILKENSGIMTSASTRGTRYGPEPDEELSEVEKEELIAGGNKHNLNGEEL